MHDEQDIKQAVRERYAGHVTATESCCGVPVATTSEDLGYNAGDLADIPEGADLGLGCGNPLAMLDLKPGETVLDLGSGGGVDCFLAARRVGPSGHVIGVDMTPEMVDRARRNAATAGTTNVEFRLGEIENLPVADSTVDAIISNCVVNLVPDKQRVFDEAFRVLRPGGRLSVSDIVLLGEVPVQILDSVEAYVACLSGAAHKDDYLAMIRQAGFASVEVEHEQTFDLANAVSEDLIAQFQHYAGVDHAQLLEAAKAFASVRVRAVKGA